MLISQLNTIISMGLLFGYRSEIFLRFLCLTVHCHGVTLHPLPAPAGIPLSLQSFVVLIGVSDSDGTLPWGYIRCLLMLGFLCLFNLLVVLIVASDSDNHRFNFHPGDCVFLGPKVVSWWSQKQSVVAQSSTETKYCSLAHASCYCWTHLNTGPSFCVAVNHVGPLVYSENMSSVFSS